MGRVLVSLYCRPRAVAQVDPAQVVMAHVPAVVSQFLHNAFNHLQTAGLCRGTHNPVRLVRLPSASGRVPVRLLLFKKLPRHQSLQACNIYRSKHKTFVRDQGKGREGELLRAIRTALRATPCLQAHWELNRTAC